MCIEKFGRWINWKYTNQLVVSARNTHASQLLHNIFHKRKCTHFQNLWELTPLRQCFALFPFHAIVGVFGMRFYSNLNFLGNAPTAQTTQNTVFVTDFPIDSQCCFFLCVFISEILNQFDAKIEALKKRRKIKNVCEMRKLKYYVNVIISSSAAAAREMKRERDCLIWMSSIHFALKFKYNI